MFLSNDWFIGILVDTINNTISIKNMWNRISNKLLWFTAKDS